jgi:hypothetical protein
MRTEPFEKAIPTLFLNNKIGFFLGDRKSIGYARKINKNI